jgi:hypothetical protein
MYIHIYLHKRRYINTNTYLYLGLPKIKMPSIKDSKERTFYTAS